MSKAQNDMVEAAARRQCPTCKKWFMSTPQRDKHVAKQHPKETQR